ncbi:MAG: AAA family ATPase [Gammaproteobacteria bacterium]
MSGTVIFLNGTSSAGKTTLALALQELLPEPYQHVALDQFRDGMPARFRGLNSPAGSAGQRGLNVVPVTLPGGEAYTEVRFGEDGQRLLRGMRRAIATMAAEGINIIIDDIILSPVFLDDYLEVMKDTTLYFVGVRCPLAVIASREAARPGRFPGTAESHFELCHAHNEYDIEVDTSVTSPAVCAGDVIARMDVGDPDAFRRLRATRC